MSNFVTCSFPQDGGTLSRNASGCGCFLPDKTFACNNGYAWCDEVPAKDRAFQIGECAYRPQQMSTMLQEFAKSQRHERTRSKYNEALVNGTLWNAAIDTNQCPIWAFVYPNTSRCLEKADCYCKVTKQWQKYNVQTGCGAPLLAIDVSSGSAPFVPGTPNMVSCTTPDNPYGLGLLLDSSGIVPNHNMFCQVFLLGFVFSGAIAIWFGKCAKSVRQPVLMVPMLPEGSHW